MLNIIKKSMKRNEILDMIYMAGDGTITKRRIKVFRVTDKSFQAFCFLRKSTRTFKVDNVLALVPVVKKEQMVI